MKNGYSICLNEWVLDKDIKNELGLLCIISSLCAEKGFCYATNKYFSELFELPEQTISRKIKLLEEKGYITIDYKKRGCEIKERYIRLTKLLTDDYQNCESTINKNVKENNINNNIYSSSSNKIIETIENEFGTLSPLMYEQVYTIIDEYDGELIIEAIKECSLKNKRFIKYLNGILKNWKDNNINNYNDLKVYYDGFNKEEPAQELFDYNWLEEE